MLDKSTEEMVERESMEADVVIVGGGPSGLSAAIRLMQLAGENDAELMVVVVEKERIHADGSRQLGRIACLTPFH